MIVKSLTPKQKKVLDFILAFRDKNDYSPSLEEIAHHFKRSIPTIYQFIESLVKKGYLTKTDNINRGITPNEQQGVEIPLLGYIAAGKPIEAIENPESLKVPLEMIKNPGQYYALKVQGNSMIEDGIYDGDTVLIKHQLTADDGQTVVAIIDENKATLKKIYHERNRIRLQAANQALLPFYRTEVEIRGVVVKIIRDLEGNNQNSLANRKKEFLSRIKSTNSNSQNKYKRVVLSPIRYAGGKSLAVGYVVELLPDNIKRVISPFLGGASVEIAIAKELGIEVIGYDIFDILINYWHYQITEPENLAKKLQKFKPTKDEFYRVKEIMRKHWKGEKKLKGLELAATYYFNHNTSYGPHFLGSQSSVYLQEKRYKVTLEKVKNFDCKKLKVFCDTFENVIPKYKNDFLYCDPPYYLDGDSKMFIGMYPHRNFPIHHVGFKHELLRDLLKTHKGGFILSYNNCSTIREWYKDFNIIYPTWQYTFSQGDTRIGINRLNGNNGSYIKKSHEVIIWQNPSK